MGADDTDTELGTENKAVNKTGKISVLIERSFQTGRQKMDCKWGEEPCGKTKEERGKEVYAAYVAREDLSGMVASSRRNNGAHSPGKIWERTFWAEGTVRARTSRRGTVGQKGYRVAEGE